MFAFSCVFFLLLIIFSKEYILIDDNLLIVFVFIALFSFMLYTTKPLISQYLINTRTTIFLDFSKTFKEIEATRYLEWKENILVVDFLLISAAFFDSYCDLLFKQTT